MGQRKMGMGAQVAPKMARREPLAVGVVGSRRRPRKLPGRRGRPSRDDQSRQVIAMVRDDVWKLDKCSAFSTFPGVRTLMQRYQREYLPQGIALKLLLDRAVGDVTASLSVSPSGNSARVAMFLRRWYFEGKTVVAVAKELGLHRSHVATTIQRPALELVASRFLTLAEQIDPGVDDLTNISAIFVQSSSKSA